MLPKLGLERAFTRTLTLVRELEAFEGPILSEYHSANGASVYVEKWCAKEGGITRSLLVRSERRAIAEYLGGRMSLVDLLGIPNDDVGFLLDRANDSISAAYLVTVSSLPKNYLPDATAFHDESLRPHWDTIPHPGVPAVIQTIFTCTCCNKNLGPRRLEALPADPLSFHIDVRICTSCRQEWSDEKAAAVRTHVEEQLSFVAMTKPPEQDAPPATGQSLLDLLTKQSQEYWKGATIHNGIIEMPPLPSHCPACGAAYRAVQAMGKPAGVIGQMLCDCELRCDTSQPGVTTWYNVPPAKTTST